MKSAYEFHGFRFLICIHGLVKPNVIQRIINQIHRTTFPVLTQNLFLIWTLDLSQVSPPFSNEATNWNWSWQALDILQVLFRFIHRGWIKQLLSRNSKLSFHFRFTNKVSNYSNTNWLKLGNYCFLTFWIRFIYYLLAEPSPSKYESRWRP
jgi:hypothetical protein